MKKMFIYGDRAKYYVIMDGEYITDWLSKAKAEKHAKNLRLLGFHAVVVRDLSIFNQAVRYVWNKVQSKTANKARAVACVVAVA